MSRSEREDALRRIEEAIKQSVMAEAYPVRQVDSLDVAALLLVLGSSMTACAIREKGLDEADVTQFAVDLVKQHVRSFSQEVGRLLYRQQMTE